jgi:hypothetical protein
MNVAYQRSVWDGSLAWIVAGVLWLSAVGVGLLLMAVYASAPGDSPRALSAWPSGSHIQRNEQEPTLVMFIHPRCPCTRASLGELEKIAARCQGKLAMRVVSFEPVGAQDWDRTDLIDTAAAIPGVEVTSDPGGVEAARFGATTSGQTFLYGARGELLFSGGITAARGHAGDNDGRAAIEAFVAGESPECTRTPVYGCPIAFSGSDD